LAGPSGGVIGSGQPTENTEVVNIFESKDPTPADDQTVAQEDSTPQLDSEADSSTDQNPDDGFAPDDGGGFFGDDDSYV
jgi:hypothetical protein